MEASSERTIKGLLRIIGWQSGHDRELTDEEAEMILEVAATQPVSDEDRARLRERVLDRAAPLAEQQPDELVERLRAGMAKLYAPPGPTTSEPVGQQTRESIAMHAMQDDVAVLLRLLGLGYHARNASPHRVMVDEIIPAVAALRATGERPDDAERAALRHQFGPSCAEVIAGERPEDGFLVSFVEAMKEGQVIDASDIDTLRRVALALRMGEKHHHQARERSEHERRTGGDAPLTGRDTRGAAVDANRDPCSGTTVESVEALRAELERRLVATLGPWVGGPYMQVAIGRSGDRTYCVFCDQESLHDDDCPALLLRTTAPGGEGESE